MFKMSSKKALSQEFRCKIKHILPDKELDIGYTLNSIGQDLFDNVCRELDLLDKDYYGLKIHDQMQWLDLNKSVVRQMNKLFLNEQDTLMLELRFKYYPAEPALLANESTRYYLYLQLRLDLIEGRLRSDSQETLAFLIACILQSELGDYTETSNQTNYVEEFKFVPNQSESLELAAIKLHKDEDFVGLNPAEAELNFLKKSCQLDTYGIDPYPVRDGNSHDHYLIGVNHLGLATFQDSRLVNRFVWDEIERLSLDNKIFLIYCRRINKKQGSKVKKPLFGFRSPSQACAQSLWKIATEHRYFFTLESTPNLPIVTNTGGIFKKSKLKYTGRVEKDLLRDHVDEFRSSGVKRSHSLMSKSMVDGPRWRGFQQGGNLQSSLNNIYANEQLNKTIPANMNYFREEDEEEGDDELGDQSTNSNFRTNSESLSKRKKSSLANSSSLMMDNHQNFKDSPGSNLHRRSVLNGNSTTSFIRKGSQVYMDTEQRTNDFIKTTMVLILLLILSLITLLLINDSDRPNTVTLIVKRLHLESVSSTLRRNYFLPLKSRIRDGINQFFIILDERLF